MIDVKFGIIGTNFISDKFAEAASRVDGVKVVAVYSRSQERGRAFAKRHDIPQNFNNLERLLNDNIINAVYVASPTFLHKDHTVLALKKGKHVLCEKSLATDFSEFCEMKASADDSGCILLEAMRPAHDPALSALLSNIERIGKIRHAHFEFRKYSSRYDRFKMGIIENAFDPEIKNSALLDIGVYPLWLAVRLFGEPIKVLSSSVRLSNGFDGAGEIVLNYGEAVVSVSYSKITEGITHSYIEGEDGTILIDKISEPHLITAKMRNSDREIIYSFDCDNNMVFEITAFRDMIRGRKEFRPFLSVSESLMRTLDRVSKAQKA